ncbi:MAG TPA: sigma-54 dependent transcriptional regulator, partial [Steroidobacteraceae bacterium]|nr:sigma-54 dependent transcriptional regulator [Steroidobacteraceae bacterium]
SGAPTSCRCAHLSVLLIGGAALSAERLQRQLVRRVGHVDFAPDLARAMRLLPRCHFDVLVIADPDGDRIRPDSLGHWRNGRRVILGIDHPEPPNASGDVEFVPGPLDADELLETIHARCSTPQPNRKPTATPVSPRQRILVGQSERICAIRRLIDRVAPLPATILIEGETGTGKELVARTIHDLSGRSGPFVPINCGAIAPELIESEIFGHAKGAFTGAHQCRDGLFVSARGGTLFLDEISEMRTDLQVKLLRALEEGCVRPVGADREVPVDVRIVASSQSGLAAKVERGEFREDLYYRLNVIHVVLPPLRERPDDISVLAGHFMTTVASSMSMPARPFDDDELRWLESRAWPGNVRELRNVVERAVLLGELSEPDCCGGPSAKGASEPCYPLDWTLEEVKQHHIQRVLDASDGNRSAAARRLGVSRKTLERKLGPGGRGGPQNEH